MTRLSDLVFQGNLIKKNSFKDILRDGWEFQRDFTRKVKTFWQNWKTVHYLVTLLAKLLATLRKRSIPVDL